MKCCQDTGATQSVVCERLAKQANLEIFPPRIGMVSLTGHGLNIVGESKVCFTFDIMKEFPNVFREKLGDLPMNVPKMKIVLSENAVPYRVSTARQVPLRFQSAAKKTVDDLVRSKVIIPADDPQDWCA